MVELEPGLLVLFQPSKQFAEKIIVDLIRSFLENKANWISYTSIDCNSHWRHAKFLFGRNVFVQALCVSELQDV